MLIKDYDSSTLGDTAWCYLSIGNGQFADPIKVPGFLKGTSDQSHMDVIDYDLNGDLDVAFAADDSVEVCLGAGDGTFLTSWKMNSLSGSPVFSVGSGDLDNDGIPDLITMEGGVFYTFPGSGNGTFGAVSSAGGFSGPTLTGADVCCGDFDEDGWNDIAVTAGSGFGSNTIFVFLNEGDGTFPNDEDYSYIDGWGFFDIFCEDLDLDGHLDLGTSVCQGDYALFLGGVGDGSFDAAQPLWFVSEFGGLETARGDFDGDGDPDVAVTRYNDTTEYPSGIYVIPNETIQDGVEGEEPVSGLLTLTPSSNPFTSSVTITCDGSSMPAMLEVFDITGHLIRSLSDPEGAAFTWDGRDGVGAVVPTGTYLVRGSVDGQASSIMVVRL